MAQQPDISSILAALAAQQPQQGAAPSAQPTPQPPTGYPSASSLPAPPPSAPPQGATYLPQPSSTGSVDLSAIKPVNSGSVSIADAIAKAKSIAADRGVSSFDPRSATPREDPRLAGRDFGRSRSRSPPRRDDYGSNPYRDERREDPRRGNFRRSPSPQQTFRGARDPPMGFRANDGETETIRVKSALVGLIIGRNGENLRKVESETGARVQFIQAKDSHVPERQCTISGSLRAREGAKAAIFSIIEENGGQNVAQEKGAYTPGMPGRAKVNLPALREGENSTQVMVPDKTVGLIIGRGGETIKDLQERSGCHVNIVGENKSVNGLRPVNLIGSESATAMAKELILEIVESDNRAASGSAPPSNRDRGFGNNDRNGGGGGGGGGRDYIEKTIHVPSEAVGMIIGKGGETIKDMQRTTGCKINVNQPVRPDVTRKIDLAGTSRSMAEAERIIWEKVETVRERDAAAGRSHRDQSGGGQSSGGGGGYNGYSQPQQQQQQPPMSGYGSYMPPAQPSAPPQMPAFQMPMATQSTPQPGSDGANASDPYAAYGGQQAFYAMWYQQQMANLQQNGQQSGAPGTQ
ncbi:hypothetical protein BAUCODRAFT_25198 [Baudoinia panamericana UAMH 10762]|uniref:K Homology domain-containing protein n=1 Tax=Baudoinia panamericana (strain UAMH 10762) TaxID=717646 RepID=M2LLD3_BAUPA|nr:uncharacterized protein BAUCODRAFT_25198 [Baudoinia panamericana UAMH 10762]EMC95082.1 hypothetical protein BAUCODRAFT_25198 [Baudoinia panamericana UAMH 10762]